jgi:DNA-binding MarR family transcriptional regulator
MLIAHELAMALRRAYLAMHRQSNAHFARLGVTADQFVVLAALADGDAVRQRELARRTSSDPNTVRAMLLLLEKQGLIERGVHPKDGRARTVRLTSHGLRTYKALWAAGEPVRARLLKALGSEDPAALIETLTRLTQAMTRQDRSETTAGPGASMG